MDIPMAKSAKQYEFEIEDGTIVSIRASKVIYAAIFCVVLVIIGVISVFGAGASCLAGIGIGHNPQNTHPAVLFAVAGGFLLLTVGMFGVAGFVGYRWGYGYVKKERFILAADALQLVIGDEVRLHLPYDNISNLEMATVVVEGGDGHPVTLHHIAIQIMDPFRKDTLIDRATLKATRKESGCDVSIGDDYDMPLKKIHKKLTKKWGAKRRF
jgi:hypothetical protein